MINDGRRQYCSFSFNNVSSVVDVFHLVCLDRTVKTLFNVMCLAGWLAVSGNLYSCCFVLNNDNTRWNNWRALRAFSHCLVLSYVMSKSCMWMWAVTIELEYAAMHLTQMLTKQLVLAWKSWLQWVRHCEKSCIIHWWSNQCLGNIAS